MENKIIKYGLLLKKKNKILGFYQTSNEGSQFCNDNTTYLSEHEDNIWSVDDPVIAEYVRNFSTEWYNADFETPKHDFKSNKLQVVKIEVITNTEPVDLKIPTMEKYLEIKFKETDPKYYEYCLKEIKTHRVVNYSLYELQELIGKGKWKPNK